LLIVDSPEAHLHPAAQSALGGFLAAVAASGVQVIVETHSDHLLNGIRKAVAVRRTIDPALVKIAFFGQDPEPARLSISERGSVSDWPAGFFDQLEADLGELTRLRQR
jgi:predicted ATPase